MITIVHHKFLPDKLKIHSWDVIEPYFTQLLHREIQSLAELETWLRHRSELDAFVSEDLAWRYVRMTCDTTNKTLEEAYLFFVSEIEPKISPLNDALNKKLMACPLLSQLDQQKYAIYLRGLKKEIEIFREENVPLLAAIAEKAQKYGAISGSMSVEMEGKELTLQQAANYLKNPNRSLRQEAFEKIHAKRAAHAEELDALFDELIALRHQVAINAGFENFRDYMFAAMGRFDYTPDVAEFFQADRDPF